MSWSRSTACEAILRGENGDKQRKQINTKQIKSPAACLRSERAPSEVTHKNSPDYSVVSCLSLRPTHCVGAAALWPCHAKNSPAILSTQKNSCSQALAQMGKLIMWDSEGERKWTASWNTHRPACNTNAEKRGEMKSRRPKGDWCMLLWWRRGDR